jgi:hypothetical protein
VNAATFCSSMNMSVLSFESIAELFCLLKMIPAGAQIPITIICKLKLCFLYLDKRALKFWTSGANDGDRCVVEGVYAWCSLNEVVPKGLLTSYMKPANSSTEHCLVMNAAGKDNSSALAHSDCAVKMPYICEPTCKQPTCPSGCVKNV